MTDQLQRSLETMADRGEWRGADTVLTTAQSELERPSTTLTPATSSRRGVLVAIAAAVGVLVLIGGVSWWSAANLDGSETAEADMVTTVQAPMTTEAAPTTTVAGTTTVVTEATISTIAPPLVSMPWQWESVDAPSVSGWFIDVTVGGPGLVAVGFADEPFGQLAGYAGEALGRPTVWTSADGSEWRDTALTLAADTGCGTWLGDWVELYGVASGPLGLIVYGIDECSSTAWVSPDGEDWERVVHDAWRRNPQALRSVTSGGPGWVAVGGDLHGGSVVWVSSDGRNWDEVIDEDLQQDAERTGQPVAAENVIAGGPGLVAVGMTGIEGSGNEISTVWTSDDGYEWNRLPDGTIGGTGLYSISRDPATGRLMILQGPGYDAPARSWSSDDGLTWTPSDTTGPPDLSGAVWVGESVVVVADQDWWLSPDGGHTWQQIDQRWYGLQVDQNPYTVVLGSFNGITLFGDRLVIVGQCNTCSGIWLSSPVTD